MPEFKYDAFVSHASEDKEAFVAPLAAALNATGLNVWYDDFTLRIGDGLRRSIDHGLANSRFGVVVLSPAFFAKEWPQREVDGLTALETADGRPRILPVWHGVSRIDVASASPMLADRLAVSSHLGVWEVANRLHDVIAPDMPEDRLYRVRHEDAIVDVVDIARREGGRISGHWFLRCVLQGPAVLALGRDLVLVRNGFQRESLITLQDRPYVGIIPVLASRIEECRFEGIGIGAWHEQIERLHLLPDGPAPEDGPSPEEAT